MFLFTVSWCRELKKDDHMYALVDRAKTIRTNLAWVFI